MPRLFEKIPGACCERVDEQFYQGRILDRIYNQIAKADIIVSDMSGRNPNVFYETGYAHALGKQVILLTKDAEDIPFDLKDYPHVVYTSIQTLNTELVKRVRWCIDNPSGSLASVDFGLMPYINQMPYQHGIGLDLEWHRYDPLGRTMWDCYFAVSFHNATERLQVGFCRIKLELPPQMGLSVDQPIASTTLIDSQDVEMCYPDVVLPDDNILFGLGDLDTKVLPKVLPDEWIQLAPRVLRYYAYPISAQPSASQCVLTLHVYTELGRKEFPIEFRPPKSER